MFRKRLQSTPFFSSAIFRPSSSSSAPLLLEFGRHLFPLLAMPTNTTDPTLQCVVEMGIPILLANNTVNAEPISMVKPLWMRESGIER